MCNSLALQTVIIACFKLLWGRKSEKAIKKMEKLTDSKRKNVPRHGTLQNQRAIFVTMTKMKTS